MKLATFLALLVALGAACGGGDASPRTTAQPAASATAARPEVASPTPTAAATATPTAGPETAVEYHFDAVFQSDQALVRAGIDIAVKYLDSSGLSVPKVDVFAGSNAERLGATYLAFAGPLTATGINFATRISYGVAEANIGSVFVYTGAETWQSLNAVQRGRVLAHEFAHVMQFELMGRDLAQRFFSRPATAAQVEGPSWLFEGSADLISWRAMEAAGLTTLETHLAQVGPQLASSDAHPRTLEAYVDFLGAGPDAREVSLMAAELLLRDRDEQPLRRYFELVRGGVNWQVAFSSAFGETQEAFYLRFDVYKGSGFER